LSPTISYLKRLDGPYCDLTPIVVENVMSDPTVREKAGNLIVEFEVLGYVPEHKHVLCEMDPGQAFNGAIAFGIMFFGYVFDSFSVSTETIEIPEGLKRSDLCQLALRVEVVFEGITIKEIADPPSQNEYR